MSRTKEVTRNESPVQANIFFNGDLGKFSYLSGPDSELVELPLPFRFTVVDDGAHRITGSEGLGKDAPRWKSNLAHEAYSRHLRVWLEHSPEEIIGEGTWGAMSNRLSVRGAKYTKLLYIITDLGFGKILACLQLKGRAYSAWIEATSKKKINPSRHTACVAKETTLMQGDKGKPSPVPVFETAALSDETKALAEAADLELQAWLSAQFSDPFAEVAHRVDRFPPENEAPFPTQAPPVAAGADDDIYGDELPF